MKTIKNKGKKGKITKPCNKCFSELFWDSHKKLEDTECGKEILNEN